MMTLWKQSYKIRGALNVNLFKEPDMAEFKEEEYKFPDETEDTTAVAI